VGSHTFRFFDARVYNVKGVGRKISGGVGGNKKRTINSKKDQKLALLLKIQGGYPFPPPPAADAHGYIVRTFLLYRNFVADKNKISKHQRTSSKIIFYF